MYNKQQWTVIANRISESLGEIESCRNELGQRPMFKEDFDKAEKALNSALSKAIQEIGMIELYGLDSAERVAQKEPSE